MSDDVTIRISVPLPDGLTDAEVESLKDYLTGEIGNAIAEDATRQYSRLMGYKSKQLKIRQGQRKAELRRRGR